MLKIGSIVWGVRNLDCSIKFWTQALHYRLAHQGSDDFAILLLAESSGTQPSLNTAVTSKKFPGRTTWASSHRACGNDNFLATASFFLNKLSNNLPRLISKQNRPVWKD